MELKWLEDFVCLAETGNFSKAAELRYVTQSAFSRRIKALEDWLGTVLVDRQSQPISLTADGVRFLENAEQSVRLFNKVRADFNQPEKAKKSSLTIGIADTLSIHFFPNWIKGLLEDFAHYYFDLYSNRKSGAAFFESLRLQEYDLLICYSGAFDLLAVDSGNLHRQVLGTESFVPVCSQAYFQQNSPDLAKPNSSPYAFIGYKANSAFPRQIEALFSKEQYLQLFDPVMESSSSESIKALVLQDFGIAWLPKSTITQELKQERLVLLGQTQHEIHLEIEMYRYSRNQKPEIAEFCQLVSENNNELRAI